MTGRGRSVTPRTSRRGRGYLGAFVIIASVTFGACTTSSPPGSVSAKPLVVLPKGAAIVHPPSPPAPQDCTASLPPPSPMPAPGNMPRASFMGQIQARGYLTVGVDQSSFLWGYPVNGTLSGFDIDILDQVAQAIFGSSDPKYIRYRVVPNVDREEAVEKGEVDILAETMTITCDRKKKVDFSTVYYRAHQQILVLDNSSINGPQDLGGKRVCGPAGSTSLKNLAALKEHIVLWAVNNESDCLVMLQQGQVDAISTDDAILLGLRAQDPNTRLVGATFSGEPYGLAISRAHPQFTSFVDGVLAEIRANGTWAQIYTNVLSPYTGTPAPTPPAATYLP